MQKRIKSVIPIYGLGIVFFVYALIFPMFRLWDIGIALALSLAAYFVLGKIFPGKLIEIELIYSSGDISADQTLATGREYIERLNELRQSIQDSEVGASIINLQNISRQIFDYISNNPAQLRRINTFMDYYLPTAVKFLENYMEYDKKGVKGTNIRETQEKIRASLYKFEEAFAHQLDNLYSDKALDIEGDIAVLESIMKQEGL